MTPLSTWSLVTTRNYHELFILNKNGTTDRWFSISNLSQWIHESFFSPSKVKTPSYRLLKRLFHDHTRSVFRSTLVVGTRLDGGETRGF